MLTALRAKYQGSENQADIAEREREFLALASEREVLSSTAFKKFAETAEKKLNELNALLMNDESCWSEKGKLIAREKTIWQTMLKAFGIKATDSAFEALESWFKDKMET